MADIIFPPSPIDGEKYLAANGITYTYDGTDGKWRASATAISSPSLNDLSDVTISTPLNKQVLRYNGAGAWVNAVHLAADIPVTPAGNLSSVNVQLALEELDAETTQNAADIAAIIPGASELNELSDVTIAAPAINQYLRYNGSVWVNQLIPANQVQFTPAGTIAAIDVQAAIEELDGDIGSLAGTDIANTSAGNIAATTVQAAIDELDTEKVGSYAAQGGTGAEADVTNIVSITQAAYDALGAPDAATLYLIDG